VKWFEQKRLADFASRPNDSLFLIQTGHDRDRHLLIIHAQLPQNFEAIDFRHVDIEQHGVVRAQFKRSKGFASVTGCFYRISIEVETISQYRKNIWIIIDHKDTFAHR